MDPVSQATVSLVEHVEEKERLRRANRLVSVACLATAIVCVSIAGLVIMPSLQRQRVELELVIAEANFAEAPPGVTLPAAMLSTFRGLIIHFLWPRGEKLKEEGKYYELQQLSEWICTLQPRYPKVWQHAAWNMAYNISVGTYTSRERWHWVWAGATLLRDKGIPYNPKSINLYYELAWNYLHKMGDFMDDHHWAYKRNVGVQLERVLGQPPLEEGTAAIIGEIRKIAEAATALAALGPRTSRDILDLYIRQDTSEPSMQTVVDQLAQHGIEPDEGLLEFVARFDREGLQVFDLVDQQAIDPVVLDALAVINDTTLSSAVDRLLTVTRAHVLLAVHKLDPQVMLELMERFGPLDWRSVYSHGLYWAWYGTQVCKDAIGIDENIEMNANRFVQFALKDSAERGRLVLEPDFKEPFNSYIHLMPDSRFIDVTHDLFLEQAEALRDGEDPLSYYREGPAGRLFKSGHVNFLMVSVRTLFLEGRRERAQFYYDYLRENYREPNGAMQEQYLQPLEDYVYSFFVDDVQSFKTGPVIINTLVEQGFLNIAFMRPEVAEVQFKLARDAHKKYMADKKVERTERRLIPPFPEMYADSLQRFMLHYPMPRRYALVMKARVWRAVDNRTQLRCYRAIEAFRDVAASIEPPLDFDKVFPAPEGLAEYEEEQGKKGTVEPEELEKKDANQGRKGQ